MPKSLFLLAGLVSLSVNAVAADYRLHTFKKIQLSEHFWSEGAAFGDFNNDGKQDVVSGPFWWEGPDYRVRHEYYAPKQSFKLKKDGAEETIPGFKGVLSGENEYSDNFLAFSQDFNKDGWDDILIYGFPGKDASWYENPGKKGAGPNEHWKRHIAFDIVDNESPCWVDITGDKKPEILCNSEGFLGYATPDWSDPTKKWTFHKISPKGGWQRFTHGIGFGDVNGDKKIDILEKDGWWEQPKSLEGDPEWKKHAFTFGTGGAQMYAYDVDDDGDNDVITSLAAHGFGLAWYENVKENGTITFKEHIFMNKEPRENKYGVKFSQLHAIDLVDMDNDGVMDIVTGKRPWAHGPKGDAEPLAAAVIYWFKLVREKGQVDFVPHLIDDNSGVGTQVLASREKSDKFPDLVVGNKRGTFVFVHDAKKVSKKEWEAAQPKPLRAN